MKFYLFISISFFLFLSSSKSQDQIAPFNSSHVPEIQWDTIWESNQAVQFGYFPVTLVGATPNDLTDDTDAINLAIKIARDHRFVCYLPAGEYMISDQLKAMIPSVWRFNQFRNEREFTPSIVGDPNNGGVVIKLFENAQNFNTVTLGLPTDESIKAAILLWAQPTTQCPYRIKAPDNPDSFIYDPPKDAMSNYTVPTDPNKECQGIAFNLTLKNITIDLNGNANTVGVRAAGAQGSTIENVTVLAEGAYAGFQNGFGEGGGMFNIRVVGGKHGLVLTDGEQSLNFHIAGAEFINQKESVFRGASYGPSTFTGLRIVKEKPALFSIIDPSQATTINLKKAIGGPPYVKGLSIIDAVIHITNPEAQTEEVFDLYNANNFYLKNVFIKGVTNLIGWTGNANAVVSNSPNQYMHIEEYIHTKNANQQVSLLQGSTSILDKIKQGPYVENPYLGNPIQKHIWQNEPWFDPENINSDLIIIDTLVGRDTNADDLILQDAINNAGPSGKVFLPRGIYYINSPLLLKSNTQLFGPDKMMSIIMAGPNFPDNPQTFMIMTEDSTAANTSLSNIMLMKDNTKNQSTSYLHWQAGKNSVVRNIMLGANGFDRSGSPFQASRFYQIDNQGGGRWYAVCAEWEKLKGTTKNEDFRMVYINNNNSPLRIYGLNTERDSSDVQVELNNANDVHVYHYKTEAGSFGAAPSIPLLIKNSTDIEIHTAFGLLIENVDKSVTPNIVLPFIKIEEADSSCITITNISSSQSNRQGINFKTIQTDGAGISELGPSRIIGTYKSCEESILECGLIKNYTFEDDLSYFETYNRQNGFTSGISFLTNGDFLQVDQVNGGTKEWEVNFKQESLFIEQGKNYRVSFSAKTDLARMIRVNVANYENNSFTQYGYQPVDITTEWDDYQFDFTMTNPDDPFSTLQFGIGGYQNNSTFFRNICLEELNCPDHLILDNYIFNDENFAANIHIESNSLLQANGDMKYKAGDNILLKQDFEVSSGAVFQALIEGCQ